MIDNLALAPFCFLLIRSGFTKQVCLTLRPKIGYSKEHIVGLSKAVNEELSISGSDYRFTVLNGSFNKNGHFHERKESCKVFSLFLSRLPISTASARVIKFHKIFLEIG